MAGYYDQEVNNSIEEFLTGGIACRHPQIEPHPRNYSVIENKQVESRTHKWWCATTKTSVQTQVRRIQVAGDASLRPGDLSERHDHLSPDSCTDNRSGDSKSVSRRATTPTHINHSRLTTRTKVEFGEGNRMFTSIPR